AVAHQGFGGAAIQLVLGGAGQGHIAGNVPDVAAGNVVRFRMFLGVVGNALALDFLQALDSFEIDAVLVVQHAAGIGTGNHVCTELLEFFHRVDGDVAGAGNDAGFSFQVFTAHAQHFLGEIHGAVTGRFAAHQGAAPLRALAGNHTGFIAVGDALVLTEEIADFPRADADVTGRY